jgi:hypothetical protein
VRTVASILPVLGREYDCTFKLPDALSLMPHVRLLQPRGDMDLKFIRTRTKQPRLAKLKHLKCVDRVALKFWASTLWLTLT